MLNLTRSRQDYLKALFALSPSGEAVPTSRLATHLGVKAPSVTNMIVQLSAVGLVSHSPRAGARLTARGRREALNIVRRHRILEAFLVRVLGLDLADVHEDAEELEHHISDRLLEALDRHLQRPTEDPHGHPIPDSNGRLVKRSLVPLAALPGGAWAKVREIDDEDAARLARWREIGLVPGARVRMRDIRPLDGVVDLEVTGRRRVISISSLEGILVQPVRGIDGH